MKKSHRYYHPGLHPSKEYFVYIAYSCEREREIEREREREAIISWILVYILKSRVQKKKKKRKRKKQKKKIMNLPYMAGKSFVHGSFNTISKEYSLDIELS